MSYFLSLLFTLSLSLIPLSLSQSQRAILINCGATVSSVIEDRQWLPDDGFISTGISINLTQTVLSPTLSTVRSFPLLQNNQRRKKFCYTVPVFRSARYLVRTTYYYYDDRVPPVFEQIVDGTLWSVVNTTDDYANGSASYYEGVFQAGGKSMSFCLASNSNTESGPYISALEFLLLPDSLYNSTDFRIFSLSLVARHSFGYNGSIIRYPDDQFDRHWEAYGENSPTISRGENVSINGIWNLPPPKVFQTQLTVSRPQPLAIRWPLQPLQNSIYYIALYFADDPSTSTTSRSFSIAINNVTYYNHLNVSRSGVALFANQWPLEGPTNILLTPAPGSTLGPLINGGEIFQILPTGGRTHTRDVIGLYSLKDGFQNPPFDWNGDPCLPKENSWTGVTCSQGSQIRVIGLNLTSLGLSGSLSPNIANLTAISDIWLGNNSLSGSIPDLSTLRMLKTIHLEDNQFNGPIPSSLGNIDRLNELFLQNNNLSGQIPGSLSGKQGLNLRVFPGNPLLNRPNP